jgi:Tol biopolymer transport system component
MRSLTVRLTAIAAAVGLLLATPAVVRALHRQTPFMLVLSCKSSANPLATCLPDMFASNPYQQGSIARWVPFESTTDIMGNGSSGSEIFLFDNEPPRALFQVTNYPTGDSHNPASTSNAGTVVFDSNSDFLHHSITARQIFTWDKQTGNIGQLTNFAADSTRPRISNSGNVIAFESKADVLGNGATGTNIYYWNPQQVCDLNGCTYFRQITSGPGTSGGIMVGGGDSAPLILFNSDSPVTGFANGYQQLFMYERATNRKTQLTAGLGDSTHATMDLTGRFVLFQSTADIMNNGSTGSEIFLLDRQLGKFQQLTNAAFGDSINPSLGGNSRYAAFVSTSDLLGTGAPVSQHLFLYDLLYGQLYQVTKGPGVSDNPVATADNIFFYDSTEDPMGMGIPGRFVYALNVFERLPNRSPGSQRFDFQPGVGQTGSIVRLKTRDGSYLAPMSGGGFDINITGQNLDAEAPIVIPQDSVLIPPIPVPSFGAVCFEPVGDGKGVLDCNGGKSGININALQDHNLDASQDPNCLSGCRENDASCQGPLTGPHFDPCPKCGAGTCTAGVNVGLVCTSDAGCPNGTCGGRTCDSGVRAGLACTETTDCTPIQSCIDGKVPVCNGPVSTALSGTYNPGDANINLPLSAKISVDPGLDNKFCTADDKYKISGISALLRLTTGTTSAGIIDADDQPGLSVGSSEVGAPFDCQRMLTKDIRGATLVGAVTIDDVPSIPGLRDVILSWRMQASDGPPCTANCPNPCTQDADCDDGNLCNGTEQCVNGSCATGTPIVCTDGNACNGVETCNPATGACGAGTAPNCADSNPCTDDSCDYFFGCVHTPNTAPCNDNNNCTTNDTCANNICKGTPTQCDDGNACNGIEVCDPATGLCIPTAPPNCDDLNPCTTDGCDSASGCFNNPNTDPCDDGDLCTTGDTCGGGSCTGTPVPCTDGNACNGLEACDPGTGLCLGGVPPNCDDGNACTDDGCDSASGCFHTINDANPCDDANACTSPDACTGGVCGGPLTPAAVLCNAGDGEPCNGDEACDPATGACLPGTPPTCDDGNACTDDSCTLGVGCAHTANDANACDDGTLCTTNACSGGTCIVTSTNSCSDNDVCNGVETCDAGTGACTAGIPTPDILAGCNDFIDCTADSCDPIDGCVHDLPPGTPGVICAIDQLRALLTAASVGTPKAGSGAIKQKVKTKLLRALDKVQKVLISSMTTSVQEEQDRLKAAIKRIRTWKKVVNRALTKDKIIESLATPLSAAADAAVDALNALIVP